MHINSGFAFVVGFNLLAGLAGVHPILTAIHMFCAGFAAGVLFCELFIYRTAGE